MGNAELLWFLRTYRGADEFRDPRDGRESAPTTARRLVRGSSNVEGPSDLRPGKKVSERSLSAHPVSELQAEPSDEPAPEVAVSVKKFANGPRWVPQRCRSRLEPYFVRASDFVDGCSVGWRPALSVAHFALVNGVQWRGQPSLSGRRPFDASALPVWRAFFESFTVTELFSPATPYSGRSCSRRGSVPRDLRRHPPDRRHCVARHAWLLECVGIDVRLVSDSFVAQRSP